MYFLGIDLGSSSVKVSVFDAQAQVSIGSVTAPESEMGMTAEQPGWAEQSPELWWEYVKRAIGKLKDEQQIDLSKIVSIGIAYQMHGLVLTDEYLHSVRPAIIWCDSRAAPIGDKAFSEIGPSKCHDIVLGSPANFTASKLKWVKENEPENYKRASFMMLPGDFIAACFTGKAQISEEGLSEAALWHFKEKRLATEILDYFEIDREKIPPVIKNFGEQATVADEVARELGFSSGVKISYRAGDQPNNAFSLNVLRPGEVAATAGTSAVIYTVSDQASFDKNHRINTFLHVNDQPEHDRNGVMLCINGSGILYQWLRDVLSAGGKTRIDYNWMNEVAAEASPGSNGLLFYPFGNGVERIFQNQKAVSGLLNLNFNTHKTPDLIRAACEGIVFAMKYGFEIMKEVGAAGRTVRAGKENLFLSPVFREIFVNTTNTTLELYNTNGAEGAARAAALGFGYFQNFDHAFEGLKCLETIRPNPELRTIYSDVYQTWKNQIKIY